MSIDVNVTNDLVIVTETTEDIVVNVSNARGADGQGVPVGGTTNQVLKKLSGTNYDTYWAVDNEGVPYTGASGNVNLGAFTLTAASLIKSGGTSSQFLKADGSVDSTTYTPTTRNITINGTTQDLSADRTYTIATHDAVTIGTANGLSISGQVLSLGLSSGSTTGALSSTDWTTFNNKQNTITNPVTGTGATGQVAYWTGASAQAGNNNLFWDAANARLGIGTNAPSRKLHVIGTSVLFQNAGTFELDLLNTTSGNYLRATAGATDANIGTLQNIPFSFTMNGARVGQFTSTNGNFILQNGGTFSDGGQRLQVMGDAFIKGSGATGATVGLTIQNSSSLNVFRVYNNGFIRLGNTGSSPLVFPQANTGVVEDLAGTNLSFYSYTSSQSASSGRYFFGGENMVQTTGANFNIYSSSQFFPTSGTATLANIYIIPQISQSGGANGITRGLYVNPTLTAAADWRSIEWSNNSGWGLYGAGTAPNYLGGTLTASSLIKSGGTSAQILAADGSVITAGTNITISGGTISSSGGGGSVDELQVVLLSQVYG